MQNEAEVLCEFVDALKMESAIIQSKQDAMFAAFMATHPSDSQVSVPVLRGQYAREFYYFNMQTALEEYVLIYRVLPRVRISDKFVPFVSPQRSLATSEEDAQNLIHKVTDIDLSEFERLVFKRWD